MTSDGESGLFPDVVRWLQSNADIKAVVLYGSTARLVEEKPNRDNASDIDLHAIVSTPAAIDNVDWARVFPDQKFCFRVKRSATGSTTKVTVIFESGRVDIIVLPRATMLAARLALFFGLQKHVRPIRSSFDEMATSMRSGYRFLKGGEQWARFYETIIAESTGVRLTDEAIRELADVFLVDLLLAATRVRRGELIAAQHALHRELVETNLRLARELHLRRGVALLSFGLGRRAERLTSATEMHWIAISSRLQSGELMQALATAFDGLKKLMSHLVPDWTVSPQMDSLLRRELR